MVHEIFIIISAIIGIITIAVSYYYRLRGEEKLKKAFFLLLFTVIVLVPPALSVVSRSLLKNLGLAVLPSIVSISSGLVALLIYIRK